MANNEADLRKLLDFVVDICNDPGNGWFKEELLRALGAGQNTGATSFMAIGENLTGRVNDIERYLSLDYKLDSANPSINYDHINKESYRDQLRQDYREMLRYRYGTRGHVIDFLEFCKFAHLQAEGLLNYYYGHRGTTIQEIGNYIIAHWPADWEKPDYKEKKKVSDISYNDKKIAFCEEFNPKSQDYPLKSRFGFTLDYIRQARNSISHRSGQREDDSWKDYFRTVMNRSGIPVRDNDFDWNKVYDNEYLYQRFKSEFQNNSKYKEYSLKLWLSRKPFDEVIEALSKLAQVVQSQIL